MPKISNKNKGFSLIESLVVIAIIAILSVIVFPYYQSARKQFALQRSANKLAQDIRRAQGMALGAEAEVAGGSVPEGGYGIYLLSNVSFYTIFVDIDSDGKYNDPGEKVEEIYLEDGVKINSINPAALRTIVFLPPDPKVFFMNPGGGDIGSNNITINIALSADITKNRDIIVNKAGLIYVE